MSGEKWPMPDGLRVIRATCLVARTLKPDKEVVSTQSCGTVKESRLIDERSEWRTFSDKVRGS